MEESSSGPDIEKYFGYEQPSFIEQIKTILDEYRNDVQIIKELVQNADDTEATTLKILYEGRNINEEDAAETKYRKFFRAPALVFYNDTTFSDVDWLGIRSIYKSVKADDPLKIGKFGLGFKSVFHLTDNPCIVSGSTALFINPHEKHPGKIFVRVSLKDVHRWEKEIFHEFMKAFNGTFGFSEKTIETGHYHGTLFWFPLRQKPSELSENVYKESDVAGLLQAFINESQRSLLFLKTLCNVEIFVSILALATTGETLQRPQQKISFKQDSRMDLEQINFGKDQSFYNVQIDTSSEDLVFKRANRLKELKEIGDNIPQISKYWVDNVYLTVISKRKFEENIISKSRWLIVNYLKGGELSYRMQELRKDKSIAYPHLVGLAAPILEDCNYISTAGHVFCFQPLPQESSSVTGLPVHVNAYFALSQNRRHIRWPDEDSHSLVCQDKKIEWNVRIVSEIFPEAYFQTILELVELSKLEGNTDHLVQAVYNTIPDLEVVQHHWKDLANNVLTMCMQNKAEIFHAECYGNWLPAEKAVIADTMPYQNMSEFCFNTVLELLEKDKVEICKVPQHVIKAYKTVFPEIAFVTPLFLRRHLTQKHTYRYLKSGCKQDLFEFVLQELSTNYLEHIELVPLADNTYCKLSTSNSIYKEDKEIIDIFPGQARRFLLPELPQELSKRIGKFKSSNKQYFLTLNASDTREMLRKVLSSNFQIPPLVQRYAANRWKPWIRSVWNLIQRRFGNELKVFRDLQIFPVLFDYPWETAKEFRLLDLKSHFLHVPYFREDEREVQVQKAFELLSVTVVKHIPKWIQHGFVDQYIHRDTEGLTKILSLICVQNFNINCKREISQALLVFLSTRLQRNITDCKHHLAKLKLFKGYTDATNFELESISENPKVYKHTSLPVFPVTFPHRIILMDSQSQETLANKLGAQLISDVQLSLESLKMFDHYSEKEQSRLIELIIHQNAVFADISVKNVLKNIRFLKSADGKYHKPSQLFDPTDKDLKKLFHDRPVFPVFGVDDDIYMTALKQLGMKTKNNLTCDDIFELCAIVHEMSFDETRFDADRCNTLLKVMNEKSGLVQKERIASKRCILANPEAFLSSSPNKEVDKTCLKCPTEIKSQWYEPLIGSLLFTINERAFPQLSDMFGWTKPPDIDDVVKHLCNVVRNYDIKRKADILPIIIKVYSFLNEQNQWSADQLRNKCNMVFSSQGGRYIWVGDGFQPPEKVYIHKTESDIDMTPFLFELPIELKALADVFRKLGCTPNIGVDMHIETLGKIKNVCESSTAEQICSEKRLLSLSIAILNKLKDDHLNDITERDIFIPVQTNRDFIKLASAKRCFYSDAPWLQDMIEDDMVEIHPDVPVATAEALGVLSLRQHLFSNAEAIEQWGQEEPLTRQIKMLLKGYTDGFSIVKEFFQNADDAGAKKMWILYDERENDDAKTNLLSENMALCQGPAIWIFNDGMFTENDLKNITKLGGATKKDDSTKIGKFGLGFCAVYNLTDVPSFISGENLVIFDPLTTHLGKSLPGKSPGMRINFGLMKNRKMLQRMKSQFKPFEGIFGCKILACSPNFNGTLFRVPLRKKPSDISETVYSHDDVFDFLNLTINLSSNLFLFNQNVQEFKIFHLSENNTIPLKMRLLFEVTKTISNIEHPNLTQTIVQKANEMKRLNQLKKPLLLLQKNTISGTRYNDPPLQTETYNSTWLISWTTGEGEHILRMAEGEKGLLCLGSVAVPIEQLNIEESSTNIKILRLENVNTAFFRKGHVFCYLPLPIEHNFSFHINGQFCVSPDRRHLSSSTEDDRSTKMKDWNDCLLSDSVVSSLLFLLVNVRKLGNLTDYRFDQLWPRSESGQHLQCVTDSFYRHIVRPDVFEIFERDGVWFDITKGLFLQSTFRKSIIGDHAFAALSMLTLNTVDICEDLYQLLQRADSKLIEERTVTEEAFFLDYFLPNLSKTMTILKEKGMIFSYMRFVETILP